MKKSLTKLKKCTKYRQVTNDVGIPIEQLYNNNNIVLCTIN